MKREERKKSKSILDRWKVPSTDRRLLSNGKEAKAVLLDSVHAADPKLVHLDVLVHTPLPNVTMPLQLKANKEAKLTTLKKILMGDLEEEGLGPEIGWDALFLFNEGVFLSDYQTLEEAGLDQKGACLTVKLVSSGAVHSLMEKRPYEERKVIDGREEEEGFYSPRFSGLPGEGVEEEKKNAEI